MYEYELIREAYSERKAERSGVPLIRHIDEGLAVLRAIGAEDITQRAFCLHSLFQADEQLEYTFNFTGIVEAVFQPVLVLVMEYRNVANRSLRTNYGGKVSLSPLKEVNQMLIADKVQNRKDFELYYQGKHEDSAELVTYFQIWLHALGISEERYQELCQLCVETP
jgi:hypothetical protein